MMLNWIEGHPAEKGYYGVMQEGDTPKGDRWKIVTGAHWDGKAWNVLNVAKYLPEKFETQYEARQFAVDFGSK